MPALPEVEREEIWRWIALPNREGEVDSLNRADLRAAINAADDWVVANSAAYNTALPQPARGVLTAPQKALLLSYVVRRRYLMLPSAELSEEERDNVYQEMIAKNRDAEVSSLTPAELRAAIDAADDWAVANAASFNSALPQPARGVLTTAQKALIFNWVVRWRWLVNA